ncbi:MAG: hypothetical protein JO332_00630 [Planctomycetaceae bacterium]|nr:hypothetical protein [Planctomycetaceae bacterium]
MRYGIVLTALAAIILAGCKSSSPSLPSTPDKPAAPSTAMAPKPTTPAAPSAPSTSAAAAKAPEAAKSVNRTPIKADVSTIKFKAEPAELFGWDDGESRAFFYANGFGEVAVSVPEDGDYEIVISASCQAAKGENAKFKLKVDGAQVGPETQLKSEDAKDYPFTTALKAGERKIGTEFTNDVYKEGEYDLNFFLNGVKVVRK